jgi:hypothetical protein
MSYLNIVQVFYQLVTIISKLVLANCSKVVLTAYFIAKST